MRDVAARDAVAGRVGAQLVFKPSETSSVALGWIGGPEQPDSVKDDTGAVSRVSGANSRMRHLFDLVVDVASGGTRAILNADYGTEVVRENGFDVHEHWYGADLTIRRDLGEVVYLGLRGSYYRDPNGYTTGNGVDTQVKSGTLTIGVAPSKNLLLKLEPRVDVANEPFFRRGVDGESKVRFTTILGVVATTD